ncbi:MAG TPA: trypsin-like peptidase domain-containing protein, partial [Gemmatimonadales bacterium]|nr:trypsin-like peptidase domain-containing protein [Gemmatimonadales bacterium]
MALLKRARTLGLIAAAFAGGLIFAVAWDLTPFGYAQQQAAPPSAREVSTLEATGAGFTSIAEHVTPAVVAIQVQREARARGRQPLRMEDLFRGFTPEPVESSGSGFIVTNDGYVLTNNHVIEGASRIRITLNDGRVFDAKVIGRDPDTDVAVVKLEGKDFPTVTFGDDEKLRIGEWVVAIGNPLGLNFTVTAGIVSAKGRGRSGELDLPGRGDYSITDLIQTDAAINPGNSGGPLVNIRGEVIGINNAIATRTGSFAGYGFAVPITLARQVLDDFLRYGRIRRAVLGVQISEVYPADAGAAGLDRIGGAKVDQFSDSDSPAREAGIQIGDIITEIDGQEVDRVSTLQRVIRSKTPGETVAVTVSRFGEEHTMRVKLDEAPTPNSTVAEQPRNNREGSGTSAGKLGISVEPLTVEVARALQLNGEARGVRVTEVVPGGPADSDGGLVAGSDVIIEILNPGPRRPVNTVEDLQQALSGLRSGDYLSLV